MPSMNYSLLLPQVSPGKQGSKKLTLSITLGDFH